MRYRRAAAAAALVPFAACASTGATFRSGVGDTFLTEAPWYAGAAVGGAPVIHMPITFQAGATQPATFEPAAAPGTPLATLLHEMNAYLDSLRGGAAIAPAAAGVAPDVHFGCERVPQDDCESDDGRTMRLAVGRPSPEWTAAMSATAAAAGAERVLVLTLETGNYMPRQRGWRTKELRLGTGYSTELPFLTALDRPMSVLQLTGVLVDRNGQAIRIGAEGLIARRTNIVAGGLGMQALISDDDVERVRTLRREDLPGKPLVWQVALASMVAQLAGGR